MALKNNYATISTSDLPGKTGARLAISAIVQPALQTSTANP